MLRSIWLRYSSCSALVNSNTESYINAVSTCSSTSNRWDYWRIICWNKCHWPELNQKIQNYINQSNFFSFTLHNQCWVTWTYHWWWWWWNELGHYRGIYISSRNCPNPPVFAPWWMWGVIAAGVRHQNGLNGAAAAVASVASAGEIDVDENDMKWINLKY